MLDLKAAVPLQFDTNAYSGGYDDLFVFGLAGAITLVAALTLGVVELRKKSPYPVYVGYIATLFCVFFSSSSTKNTRRLFTAQVFSTEEAKSIIKATEGIEWSTERHQSYPTVDINVASQFAPSDLSSLESLFDDRVAPLLYLSYGIPPRTIRGHDIFVIKYDATGKVEESDGKKQRGLKRHTDGGYLSVNVALNDDYEGGGTVFFDRPKCDFDPQNSNDLLCDDERSRLFIKLQPGHAVAHCAKVLHEGREITEGVRYILVFFLQIDTASPEGEAYKWWGWLKDLGYLDSRFSELYKATKEAVSLQRWNHDKEGELTRSIRKFRMMFYEKAHVMARGKRVRGAKRNVAAAECATVFNVMNTLVAVFADIYGDFNLYSVDISGGVPQEVGKANWFEGQRWELDEWGKLVPRSEGEMNRIAGVSGAGRDDKV